VYVDTVSFAGIDPNLDAQVEFGTFLQLQGDSPETTLKYGIFYL
jgi:hypothetical protein